MPNKTYTVLIIDMAHFGDEQSNTTLGGFLTLKDACEFAKRRLRDSLEELRQPHQHPADLLKLWVLYGEDVIVVGGDKRYSASTQLDYFINHPATLEERNWKAIKRIG